MRNFGEVKDQYGKVIIKGVDQLQNVIESIRNKPEDRRIIMSLWNPQDNPNTLLPPCPCFYQFFANQEGMLHVNVYQRSCDSFLGVPFNDSQDALMLILLAKVTGRKPNIFNHTFGDVHIYNNHRKQIDLQLTREPRPLPSIRINRETQNILDFKYEDLELIDYDPWPGIPAPVAV
jgi:thymidylate synthase